MADSVRTRTSLLSLYADNSTQNISPQDLRDGIVSVMGVLAHLYVTGNSTAQTGIGTSYVTVDWGNGGGDGDDDNAASDYANDRIEVGSLGDGVYLLAFQASFTGSASAEFTFAIANNGTPLTGAVCMHEFTAAAEKGSCSIVALATLSDGDLVTVQVKADAASKQITMAEAQLVAKRLK